MNRQVEVMDEKGQREVISLSECLDRFGTMPSGAHERIRGTKPKRDDAKLKAKRTAARAARKKNRK